MHARSDNPELLRAQELGLHIYSFPEYLFERTRDKLRVVVAGSHGKTTITSMILHVLRSVGRSFDYMVGAQLEGFDTMVGLSEESELAVFEGDEYLSSPLDRRPKFHLYRPHVALISGIAWDHINVFPTYQEYEEQFRVFVGLIENGGVLVFNDEDPVLTPITDLAEPGVHRVAYRTHPYMIDDGKAFLLTQPDPTPVNVFGRHNMQNIAGAKAVCLQIGISESEFYAAMAAFQGASRRLQILKESDSSKVFLDFAHAPSKVLATTRAVRELHPERELVACLELHTFSSLNAEFLTQYRGALDAASRAIVYFDPHTLEHKRLPQLEPAQIASAFGRSDLIVQTSKSELEELLESIEWPGKNLLLMSSGYFSGIDFNKIVR
jgi:UDP-N-acetylmuramate: L-alanyl-gamma-D-glutamyl-meso-diaminopimelate ligase